MPLADLSLGLVIAIVVVFAAIGAVVAFFAVKRSRLKYSGANGHMEDTERPGASPPESANMKSAAKKKKTKYTSDGRPIWNDLSKARKEGSVPNTGAPPPAGWPSKSEEELYNSLRKKYRESKVKVGMEDADDKIIVSRGVNIGKIGGDVIGVGNITRPKLEEVGSVPEDTQAQSEIELKRYPSATFPEKIVLNEIAPLKVSVKAGQFEKSPVTLNIIAQPSQKEVPIDVIVEWEPRDAFEIVGKYYAQLFIPVKEADSRPVVFSLKAKKLGTTRIKIDFYQDSYLDRLEVLTEIVDAPSKINQQYPREVSADLTFQSSPHPADLSLIIYETTPYPVFEYEIHLKAESLDLPFIHSKPVRLRGNPEEEFRAFFRDIEHLIESGRFRPELVEESLRARGTQLYKRLIPQELRDVIWENRERIRSVQVISEEPWIPWEMLKSCKGAEEDDYFCQKYAFSRWKAGVKTKSKTSFEKVKLVVPRDTNLAGAKEESEWLESFSAVAGYQVSQASGYDDVFSTLRNGGFDIIHFSSHGLYNEGSSLLSKIILESNLYLTPDSIGEENARFGNSNPIILLNACQTGQEGFSLTDIGGWASSFLQAQASAFIGTMWSVTDRCAFEFSRGLYERLAIGMPLDEAVRQARNASRQPGDPSWLAYTLYSKPNMPVKLGTKEIPHILGHYAAAGRLVTACKKCGCGMGIIPSSLCPQCRSPVDLLLPASAVND